MKLRFLNLKDAELMLEWMHDPIVVETMGADFKSKTIDDCKEFIHASLKNKHTALHLAVVDDNDVYQGTVSLKHINYKDSVAEFAITIRQSAMGRGFAQFAMKSILTLAEQELHLKKIYWCVRSDNTRAIHFYDKSKYKKTSCIPQELRSLYSKRMDLLWYVWQPDNTD